MFSSIILASILPCLCKHIAEPTSDQPEMCHHREEPFFFSFLFQRSVKFDRASELISRGMQLPTSVLQNFPFVAGSRVCSLSLLAVTDRLSRVILSPRHRRQGHRRKHLRPRTRGDRHSTPATTTRHECLRQTECGGAAAGVMARPSGSGRGPT